MRKIDPSGASYFVEVSAPKLCQTLNPNINPQNTESEFGPGQSLGSNVSPKQLRLMADFSQPL